MNVFSERLTLARESRALSKLDLANLCKIDNSQIGRYEKGQSDPNATTLKALASALDVSTDWLLGLSESPTRQGKVISPTAWAAARLVESMSEDRRAAAIELLQILARLKG